MDAMANDPPLLEIEGLTIDFASELGQVRALDKLDLSIGAGEIAGLVGESGSGKSMTALAVLGLVPSPGAITAGSIRFAGRELLGLSEREFRTVRGREIAIMFQEPGTALHPLHTIRAQIAETIRAHEPRTSRREAGRRAVELLAKVRIDAPDRWADRFPHELSGGMRQRAMLAIALACRPRLLLADEPTTALDATVAGEVLALIEELRRDDKLAVLLISHDLSVVAAHADRVTVLERGRVVETGVTSTILERPKEAYTRELILARPRLFSPPTAPSPRVERRREDPT